MRREHERSTESLQVEFIEAVELLAQEIVTIRRLLERGVEMMSDHEQPSKQPNEPPSKQPNERLNEPLQVTLAEAARLLNYKSLQTVRARIASGDLVSTGEGRGFRVTMKSIRNFVEAKSSLGRR